MGFNSVFKRLMQYLCCSLYSKDQIFHPLKTRAQICVYFKHTKGVKEGKFLFFQSSDGRRLKSKAASPALL